jgi:hypothetical protein
MESVETVKTDRRSKNENEKQLGTKQRRGDISKNK